METKLAGVFWGLSVLFQLATILITAVWALIARSPALMTVMLRSFVLTSCTGLLCLFALFSDSWGLKGTEQFFIVGVGMVNLFIVAQTMSPRHFRYRWPRPAFLTVTAALAASQLAGGVLVAFGRDARVLIGAGRWWLVVASVGLYALNLLHRRSYLVWKSPVLDSLPSLLFCVEIAVVFQPWSAEPMRFFSVSVLAGALIPAISIGRPAARLPSGRPNLFILIRNICRFETALLPFTLFDAFAPAPYHQARDVFPFVLIQSLVMFALVMRYSVRSAFSPRASAPEAPALSQRQSEVAALLVQGLTYGEIASRLFVSTETVKSHAKAVYEKYGVPGRAVLRRRFESHPR